MHLPLLLIALALPGALPAQQSADEHAVLATLDRFFDGMTRRDTALSREVLLPGSVFYATIEGPAPTTRITTDAQYLAGLGTGTSVWRERTWNPTVLVHGSVAEVWTPYDFHVDGKFSHCGIDSFTFVKTATGWRMATAAYTIQPTDCAPSPLGELK